MASETCLLLEVAATALGKDVGRGAVKPILASIISLVGAHGDALQVLLQFYSHAISIHFILVIFVFFCCFLWFFFYQNK